MIQEKQLLAIYDDAGALLCGHFILSSGRHSPRYLQSARVLMDPNRAEFLGAELASLAGDEDIDLVISPALGGLIIGYEVARALGVPFIFSEREQGKMVLRRGFTLPKDAHVLVVEDVITTGGSVRECMQVVRDCGALPVRVLALVDRAPGMEDRFDIPHSSLLRLQIPSYPPESCPLCREGMLPAVKPGSRGI